jgi:hypothetical protein
VPDITLPAAVSLAPGHTRTVRIDSLFDATPYLGKRFTLTYASDHPVYSGMFQSDRFDGVSTDVAVAASSDITFGEGFMDPARAGTEVFETVAVNLVVRYTDGYELTISRTVAAGRTTFIDLHTLEEIRVQGLENHRYYYSMEVSSSCCVVSQLTHLDTNLGRIGNAAGGFSTMGIESGTPTMLDSI